MTISQNNFYNKLVEIDDNFMYYENNKFRKMHIKFMKKEEHNTLKEYYTQNDYDMYLSNVNLKMIKQLLDYNNDETNPFKEMYELDTFTMELIFFTLSKTHKALIYYDKYVEKFRNIKGQNKQSKGSNPKSNAINQVIKLIRESDISLQDYEEKLEAGIQVDYYSIPQSFNTVEYLKGLLVGLENHHYTKIQLYQNLLYDINFILKDKMYKNTTTNNEHKFSKLLILSIVDKLIKYYFCENGDSLISDYDDKKLIFKNPNFDKYITLNYQYETKAGITLTHSTKGI